MIQAWILGNASWFYILTVAIIPLAVIRGGQPLRQYRAGAGPQRARLPRYHLVRHAVLDRHGIGLMFFLAWPSRSCTSSILRWARAVTRWRRARP